jgi:hypothetical protein
MAQPLGITLHLKIHFTNVPILYFWKSTFWRGTKEEKKLKKFPRKKQSKGRQCVDSYVRSKDKIQEIRCLHGSK